MDYQATNFLGDLYADRPVPSTPEATPTATDSPVIPEPEPSQAGPTVGTGQTWADAIDPGRPCPRCDSLEKWWDLLGGEHCMICNPPVTGVKTLEAAQRIRRRHGIPDPPGTVELLTAIERRNVP
jgi:hypothetical protein